MALRFAEALITVTVAVALLAGCSGDTPIASGDEVTPGVETETPGADAAGATAPPDSRPTGGVVPIDSTGDDTLRDLIRPGDPAAEFCLVDRGVAPGEFYDKPADELVFPNETYFFEARYDDGSIIEIRVHPNIVDDSAITQAERIAEPISLLPTELRGDIERVGFLGGNASAQADGGGEGIHVYEDNVRIREDTNRFEETIFHESVHTSLDDTFGSSPEWAAAQQGDGQFLTQYAASDPETEDLAETALYAWALLNHPDRISAADEAAWRSLVPERIAFVDSILSAPGEGYTRIEPSC